MTRHEVRLEDTASNEENLFGPKRNVFLSEGRRRCLSVPIGDAELAAYLGMVEEFLATLTR